MVRCVLALFAYAGLLFWLSVAPLCWILRDGLGPNSVDSDGWHAVGRFLLTFHWGPVALVLAALAAGATFWARSAGGAGKR